MVSKRLRAFYLSNYSKFGADYNAHKTTETLINYTVCYLLVFINLSIRVLFLLILFLSNFFL